jgi:hypothetical protein
VSKAKGSRNEHKAMLILQLATSPRPPLAADNSRRIIQPPLGKMPHPQVN